MDLQGNILDSLDVSFAPQSPKWTQASSRGRSPRRPRVIINLGIARVPPDLFEAVQGVEILRGLLFCASACSCPAGFLPCARVPGRPEGLFFDAGGTLWLVSEPGRVYQMGLRQQNFLATSVRTAEWIWLICSTNEWAESPISTSAATAPNLSTNAELEVRPNFSKTLWRYLPGENGNS